MDFRGLAPAPLLACAMALSWSSICAQPAAYAPAVTATVPLPAADPAVAEIVAAPPAPPPVTPDVVPPAQPPAAVTVPDPVDEDEAEAKTATAEAVSPPPAGPAPYNPLASSTAAPPVYARPPVDTSGTPVHIDEIGRTPDRPLNAYDQSYDARLRASSASAQGMLGPLDGSWRLSVDGAGDLYALELVDRGGLVEGAWRDLRRAGLDASGFLEDIQRLGSTLTVRFRTARGATEAILNAQVDGRWTGEYVDGDRRRSATLRRN